ncbi:DeoR/GlpR family DNA-binding transcription regulator [Tropicimonas sediminicola]|uniref:Transcriptional regulator, DeoR family n=1 Tax=Tropicimonas sediminicola TaxID=1031541 RepID=A0A239I5N3_9RHOB|nr:DeoR/GlpR family DNA-binding transcription regulator [Tropicimonas sediminicola]SNS88925.1 transcriptional regulator, DeoR family [Tropicimonas sediminicola]
MSSDSPLNSPEARQAALRSRAAAGEPLSLAALAEEFGVSADTIRRDLLVLEAEGALRRVRGGALPVAPPAEPLAARMRRPNLAAGRIAAAALPLVEDGMVLMLDGGTTVAHLVAGLPPLPRALVVTPSPAVATSTLAAGIETVLIGGKLSAFGGISTGADACEAIAGVAADICFLGACGLEAGFGLAADHLDEAAVKRAMHAASARSVVLAGAEKLGRRARHRVAACAELDLLVTDAPPQDTAALVATGLEIRHA